MIIWALLALSLPCVYGEDNGEEPPRPIFPDVFTLEIQAIFQTEESEADFTIYYDAVSNRAAVDMFYQNEDTKQIYFFNESQVIHIQDNDCSVKQLSDDDENSFFLFSFVAEEDRHVLMSPEEMLYFVNSTFKKRDDTNYVPLYIYEGTIDITKFGRRQCIIRHAFSQPQFAVPECELRSCQTTLFSISLDCPATEDGEESTSFLFRVVKFLHSIKDDTLFQAPVGVFCDMKNSREFPVLPHYFGLSYNQVGQQLDAGINAVHIQHKRLWYDGDVKLVRTDDFDANGIIGSHKVYDFANGMAYVIIPGIQQCNMGPLPNDITLAKTTVLPSVIFPVLFGDKKEEPVYVGKRKISEIAYHVWVVEDGDADSGRRVVKELYFVENVVNHIELVKKGDLQLSSVAQYGYEPDMREVTYNSINRFTTSPRDWTVFDIVSGCYDDGQQLPFEIVVEGPPVHILTVRFHELMEILYHKLVAASKVSVIRISDLQVANKTENTMIFHGIILDKPDKGFSSTADSEPDMKTAFSNINSVIDDGLLKFQITKYEKEFSYEVTSIAKLTFMEDGLTVLKQYEVINKSARGYGGGAMAAAAICMMFVGMAVGVIMLFAYHKVKRDPKMISLAI